MNLFSLLAFFTFVVYVYFGAYVWRREPSVRLNRSFALLCACFAYWAGLFAFIYVAATKDLAWTLYRLAAPGWFARRSCARPGACWRSLRRGRAGGARWHGARKAVRRFPRTPRQRG